MRVLGSQFWMDIHMKVGSLRPGEAMSLRAEEILHHKTGGHDIRIFSSSRGAHM